MRYVLAGFVLAMLTFSIAAPVCLGAEEDDAQDHLESKDSSEEKSDAESTKTSSNEIKPEARAVTRGEALVEGLKKLRVPSTALAALTLALDRTKEKNPTPKQFSELVDSIVGEEPDLLSESQGKKLKELYEEELGQVKDGKRGEEFAQAARKILGKEISSKKVAETESETRSEEEKDTKAAKAPNEEESTKNAAGVPVKAASEADFEKANANANGQLSSGQLDSLLKQAGIGKGALDKATPEAELLSKAQALLSQLEKAGRGGAEDRDRGRGLREIGLLNALRGFNKGDKGERDREGRGGRGGGPGSALQDLAKAFEKGGPPPSEEGDRKEDSKKDRTLDALRKGRRNGEDRGGRGGGGGGSPPGGGGDSKKANEDKKGEGSPFSLGESKTKKAESKSKVDPDKSEKNPLDEANAKGESPADESKVGELSKVAPPKTTTLSPISNGPGAGFDFGGDFGGGGGGGGVGVGGGGGGGGGMGGGGSFDGDPFNVGWDYPSAGEASPGMRSSFAKPGGFASGGGEGGGGGGGGEADGDASEGSVSDDTASRFARSRSGFADQILLPGASREVSPTTFAYVGNFRKRLCDSDFASSVAVCEEILARKRKKGIKGRLLSGAGAE